MTVGFNVKNFRYFFGMRSGVLAFKVHIFPSDFEF